MVIMKEKVIEMVRKGRSDKEIMRELGIPTRASLRTMYYDALVEAGKVRDIVSEREFRKRQPKKRVLTIGKRGTILLSKALLVDQFGFKEGDRFRVTKRRDSIILRRAE